MMDLLTKDGASKLVDACTYPLTGVGCVSRVYTERAVFEVGAAGATVLDTFGVTLGELRDLTGLDLR
jgi:3-oxoadipate CoA-transferase beta subunit